MDQQNFKGQAIENSAENLNICGRAMLHSTNNAGGVCLQTVLLLAKLSRPARRCVLWASDRTPIDTSVTDAVDDDGFDDAGAGTSGIAAAADDLGDFGDDDAWGDELDDFGDLGDADADKPDEMAGLADVGDDSGFQMPVSGRPPAG